MIIQLVKRNFLIVVNVMIKIENLFQQEIELMEIYHIIAAGDDVLIYTAVEFILTVDLSVYVHWRSFYDSIQISQRIISILTVCFDGGKQHSHLRHILSGALIPSSPRQFAITVFDADTRESLASLSSLLSTSICSS